MKIVVVTVKIVTAVPEALCSHMLDESRAVHHRMATGVAVMSVGVAIAKVADHSPTEVIAFLGDGIGYAVHGLGLTPFADHIIRKFNKHD